MGPTAAAKSRIVKIMKHKAISEAALADLIPEFYARIRKDPVLGPVFNGAIDDWGPHLAKLQAFWSSVMLTSGRYKGRPLPAHIKLGKAASPAAFERWLGLWRATTADLFEAEPAAGLQDKAARIAESLQLGIAFDRRRRTGTDPLSGSIRERR